MVVHLYLYGFIQGIRMRMQSSECEQRVLLLIWLLLIHCVRSCARGSILTEACCSNDEVATTWKAHCFLQQTFSLRREGPIVDVEEDGWVMSRVLALHDYMIWVTLELRHWAPSSHNCILPLKAWLLLGLTSVGILDALLLPFFVQCFGPVRTNHVADCSSIGLKQTLGRHFYILCGNSSRLIYSKCVRLLMIVIMVILLYNDVRFLAVQFIDQMRLWCMSQEPKQPPIPWFLATFRCNGSRSVSYTSSRPRAWALWFKTARWFRMTHPSRQYLSWGCQKKFSILQVVGRGRSILVTGWSLRLTCWMQPVNLRLTCWMQPVNLRLTCWMQPVNLRLTCWMQPVNLRLTCWMQPVNLRLTCWMQPVTRDLLFTNTFWFASR